MKTHRSKYCIIGAGLSGLAAGYALHKSGESNFLILESRDRIGGRILTENGVDYGATWFQNHHDTVSKYIDELQLKKFRQYAKGKNVLVYTSMGPAHYFESDPNTPSAYRVVGGTSAMIHALAAPISSALRLNTFVTEISKTETGVKISTNNGSYETEKLIITIPPQLATKISFIPPLPEATEKAMELTHTWMSNASKVGLTFKKPFWRLKGFSGTIIGQVGAVTELYDHASEDEKEFALMGFLNENLRALSAEARKEKIVDYIATHLGAEVKEYLTYTEKDWARDKNTSLDTLHAVYGSPQYGRSQFQQSYFEGRLLFSCAETSTVNGGYMDGALRSAENAAAWLLG